MMETRPNGPKFPNPIQPRSFVSQGQSQMMQQYGIQLQRYSNHIGYAPPPPPPRPPQPPQAVNFIRPMMAKESSRLLPPGVTEEESSSSGFSVQPMYAPAVINADGSYAPLAPPPLPPLFPYLSPELAQSLHDGATLCGTSFAEESSDLPFVPVIINDCDLKKMTESVKTQFDEEAKKNLLLYKDIIDQSLPKELIDMFQPLYCKLCKLTLSSPVVARDHYKGKRHMRCIEVWKQQNPSQFSKNYPLNRFNHTAIKGSIRPLQERPSFPVQNNHSHMNNGFSVSNNNPNGFQRPPDPSPNTSFNPSNKRYLNGDRKQYQQQPQQFQLTLPKKDFIPAYRANLASPSPARKKPKKEGGGGPNYGYCRLCDVHHTSSITAEQHYSGQKHKMKVLQIQKEGQDFGDDPRFGIGSSFLQKNNQTTFNPALEPNANNAFANESSW